MNRPRGSLPILFSIVVLDLIGFGIVLPVLPFYAKTFGASASVLGVLLTSYAAAQFVAAPLWGRLSDRIGRRPVMLATIAGTSLSLVGLGLADSMLAIFAARILAGVFGANISVATAYVSDVTSEDERTRWMGMIGASFGVGFLLGPAIGGALAPYGYGVPMLVAGAMAAVNGVYAAVVLVEPERRTPPAAREGARMRVLGNPLVRRLCGAYFTYSFAVSQLETVFAFFMMDRFGYDARGVAAILVVMALVMLAIQGGAIRGLAARFGEKTLLLSGALLMIAAFASIPWMFSVPLLLVPLLVSAAGRAISQPSMASMVSVSADADQRGAVMGAFQSSASLARVIGPLAAGALYDWIQGSPFLVASVLLMGTAGLAAGLPAPRTPLVNSDRARRASSARDQGVKSQP